MAATVAFSAQYDGLWECEACIAEGVAIDRLIQVRDEAGQLVPFGRMRVPTDGDGPCLHAVRSGGERALAVLHRHSSLSDTPRIGKVVSIVPRYSRHPSL
jgi:hypothetical protein